jgi:hypothetical protein
MWARKPFGKADLPPMTPLPSWKSRYDPADLHRHRRTKWGREDDRRADLSAAWRQLQEFR